MTEGMAEGSMQGNGEFTSEEAISRVRQDIDELVSSFDLRAIADQLEEFGRANPVGLAIGALALGVAAGLLMRRKL